MYPLDAGQVYPFDQWYIAGWADEFSRDIVERRILGELVAFYRTEAGDPVAVAGLCPHRYFPFSKGRLVGDAIQCGYHGFTFDCTGACVKIPSQDRVPARFRVRTYPVATRWEWVWIWMGDPAAADEAKIPDLAGMGLGAPGWYSAPNSMLHLAARYTLLIDNLLDLTHIGFVHASTISEVVIDTTHASLDERDGLLRIEHRLPGLPPGRFDRYAFPHAGAAIEKTFRSDYYGPCLINAAVEWFDYADGARGRSMGITNFVHGITPETPHSTHYFPALARNFRTDDHAFSEAAKHQNLAVIKQDVEALGQIEPHVDRHPGVDHELSGAADALAIRARRKLSEQIRAEAVRRTDTRVA